MFKNKLQKQGLLIVAIIFISATLRAPITAIGPIAELIHQDLQVSNGFVGFITTLPLLAFALLSPFLSKISDRLGLGTTMMLGLVFIAAGGLIRSYTGIFGLLLGTTIIGIGIAAGNVLIPGVVKLKFPDKIGVVTSSYATCMSLFASIGAGVSYPLAVNMGLGWKNGLVLWSVVAIGAIVMWLPHLKLNGGDGIRAATEKQEGISLKTIWKSPTAWFLTMLFGFQSLIFYSMGAWLPSILVYRGFGPEVSGYMTLWFQLSAIPASLSVPIITSRVKNQRGVVMAACGLYVLGFTILFTAESFLAIMIALSLVAMGGGACFVWCLAMFSILGDNPQASATLSGMCQSIGYLLAAIGPTMCGAIYDITGSWTAVIGLFFAMTAVMLLSGHFITKKDKLFI